MTESTATPPVTGAARIALGLTYLAAAATPWNGWQLGGLRPGDIFLALALVACVLAGLGGTWPPLPRWVWLFGAVILAVTFLHILDPTDPLYLAQRLVVDARGVRIPELESNLTVGLKFVVPIVGLPLLFAFARSLDSRAILRAAYAFAVGSALSAAIGVSDSFGVTALSASITGLPATAGRAPGLAVHPNFLATTCVLGLPVVMWQAARTRARARTVSVLLTVVLALGVYASGSRGGAAVLAGAVILCFVLMPEYRRFLPSVALISGVVLSIVFVIHPAIGSTILQAVRLSGDTGSASGSDVIRAEVGRQGLADFRHSPLDGVGLQVAAEAHNVYLQALASGGLLLLAGYVVYVGAGLVRGFRLTRETPLAYPLFIAALSGALLSIVENALTDRLAYVPIALIAALPLTQPAPAGPGQDLEAAFPDAVHPRFPGRAARGPAGRVVGEAAGR